MLSVNPLRLLVPLFICVVSMSASIAFMALNKKDYNNSYDQHAYTISIVTVVIFVATYPAMKLVSCIDSCLSPVKIQKKEEEIEIDDVVGYAIYSSITYFVFSTVYAIYALTNHMITSSDRSSGTRNASLVIAISVIINWSLALLLIITEYCVIKRNHANSKIVHSTTIVGNGYNNNSQPIEEQPV
jgi:hypothetical protein